MNKKHLYIIGAVLLVTIVIIIVVSKNRKAKKQSEETGNTGTESKSVEDAAPSISYQIYTKEIAPDAQEKSYFDTLPAHAGYPIKYGTISKSVYAFQKAMNKIHNSGLKLDGIFGDATRSALKANYNTDSISKELANKLYYKYF